MENNAEKFDKLFRDKLENVEIPYEQAHWEELESKMDALPKNATTGISAGKIAIISGAVLLAVVATYYLSQDEKMAEPTTTEALLNEKVIPENSTIESQGSEATPDDKATTEHKSETEKRDSAEMNENKDVAVKDKPKKTIEEEISHISSQNATLNKIKSEDYIESHTDNVPEDASIANFNNERLKTEFTADKTKICVGNEVQFTTKKDISGASYYWNFGDGGITSREQNPNRKFMRPGVFTVTLIVSKGEKNDYITKMERYIEVEKTPDFSIEWDDSEPTSLDPYTEFKAISDDKNASFSWKIDSKEYNGEVAEHIFKKKGNYLAELTVANGKCTVTKVEEIEILETAELPIENSFTVNSDGLNDVFPAILSSIEVPFKLKILDNTGKQLYYTESNNSPWNGKVNNTGEVVPEGTYKCVLITTDKYNKEHLQVGVVKVLR